MEYSSEYKNKIKFTKRKRERDSNGVKFFIILKFQKHLVIVKVSSFWSMFCLKYEYRVQNLCNFSVVLSVVNGNSKYTLFYHQTCQLFEFHLLPYWLKSINLGLLNRLRNTKGEVSLYNWPPVWLVWNHLYDYWQFLFYLQNRLIQTSQTGGQWYSDTSPFSFPCFVSCLQLMPEVQALHCFVAP